MRCRVSPVLGLTLPWLLSAASLVLGGCGRPETVADRQFAEMREQVTKLEAETDKLDRSMGPLEAAGADEKLPRTEPAGTGVPAAPNARVVQLGGPSEADPADPNDPGARPDIKLTGVAGASPSRPRAGKSNGRVRIDESDPSEARPVPETARSIPTPRRPTRRRSPRCRRASTTAGSRA